MNENISLIISSMDVLQANQDGKYQGGFVSFTSIRTRQILDNIPGGNYPKTNNGGTCLNHGDCSGTNNVCQNDPGHCKDSTNTTCSDKF